MVFASIFCTGHIKPQHSTTELSLSLGLRSGCGSSFTLGKCFIQSSSGVFPQVWHAQLALPLKRQHEPSILSVYYSNIKTSATRPSWSDHRVERTPMDRPCVERTPRGAHPHGATRSAPTDPAWSGTGLNKIIIFKLISSIPLS